jgi:hypothetical protein
MWLCWEPSILFDNDRLRVQNNVVWSADYTYNWLIKRLIPTVIEYRRDKDRSIMKKLFVRKKTFPTPFDNFNTNLAQACPNLLSDFKDIESFKNWVDEVQRFFVVHSNHYLTVNAMKNVYESILFYLKYCKVKKGTFEYIRVKLDGNQSIETVIISVESKIKALFKKKVVNGSNME